MFQLCDRISAFVYGESVLLPYYGSLLMPGSIFTLFGYKT